jgi:hypothetical protein
VRRPGRPHLAARALPTLALCLALSACTSYSTRLAGVRDAVAIGDPNAALEALDPLVVAAEEGHKPEEADYPLLLLERAALLQAIQEHHRAVADFTAADELLEVLDLTPDRVGQAAEYLWSGSASLYRPPVYEKLMVNVAALASWLAMGDYGSARVEARRIGVLLDYFDETELYDHPMLGAAAFMAGLAMELGGEPQAALRFYIAAWERGDAPGLAESLVLLAEGTTLAGNPAVAEAREALGLGPGDRLEPASDEEIVAIVFHGLAPHRYPEYLPVGAVVAMFRIDASYAMTPDQEAALARNVAEDLLTWVNFPRLAVWENSLAKFDVSVDGARYDAGLVADVESFAIAQWERDRPGIAFAAITRALVRIAAREAVQAVGRAAGGAGQTIGFLAGLATQGAMQAADKPDTRTWTLMPAYISLARFPAEPGEHVLTVEGNGRGITDRVEVPVYVPERGTGVATVRFLR